MQAEGNPSPTRDSLLDAAKRVMQRDGAGHLTLDAVAKEAGVSKGGLLYHFPNKQALLRGMMAKGIAMHEAEMAEELGPNPRPGEFAKYFLRHSMLGPPKPDCKPPVEMVWSMLGAAANDPTLLEPVRQMHARWQKQLESDLKDADMATLIRMIGHGLWSSEVFGFSMPDVDQRERILKLLNNVVGLDENVPHEGNNRKKEEIG